MTVNGIVPALECRATTPLSLGSGWYAIRANDTSEALAAIDHGVGIIVVHFDDDTADLIAALRSSGRPAAAVPLIVTGAPAARAAGGIAGADLVLPQGGGNDVAAALEPWRPAPLPDAYERLEGAFGAETVRGMARRLCEVLAAALEAAETPDAADSAHRVAGVAGTLGFGDLGRRWLELSYDPGGFSDSLRRDTRTTIAAIVLRTEGRG